MAGHTIDGHETRIEYVDCIKQLDLDYHVPIYAGSIIDASLT